jgi:hypothetical protein
MTKRLTAADLRAMAGKTMSDEDAEQIINSLEQFAVLCCELYYRNEKTKNKIINLNGEENESSGIAA